MKIVIFDMDGTLIDSKKDITISINYIRKKHYGLSSLSEEFVVDAINKHERNLPKLFYETPIYQERDRELFETHYSKQCIQNTYLYDGVLEMLQELVASDVKVSLATNASTNFAEIMLKNLGIAEMFDVVMGADKVALSKPDPQMIYEILDYYNYNSTRDKAWMVGDNSKDMLSAKNANIASIFATWGFTSNAKHKLVVLKPKEILDIVL